MREAAEGSRESRPLGRYSIFSLRDSIVFAHRARSSRVNASNSMLVTLLGIVMLVKLVQR